MHWVVLHRNIPDLLERINPPNNPLEYTPCNDNLSALASVLSL
jgi:hypothetical protein